MNNHNLFYERNNIVYCLLCWFASEEAKIYGNNFNSSNAVELERNGWFFF